MDAASTNVEAAESATRWQPVGALERRILGVLAEKAKTTPDAYPMSLNALCTGCNQKSNRHPQMQVEPDDLEPALDQLKRLGAVTEVLGGGRVSRFRHQLYEWLGVGKLELAVMAELLLRGAQTVGELRTRASRMEPMADMSVLRPVLESLEAKRLVVFLTPAGRGQVVTHALYEPRELDKLRSQYSQYKGSDEHPAPEGPTRGEHHQSDTASPRPGEEELRGIRDELRLLREEIEHLKSELASLRAGSL